MACGFSPVYGQVDRWNDLTSAMMQKLSSGGSPEAISLGKQALDVAKKTFGTQHVNYGLSLNNLGWAYLMSQKYSDAEPLFRQSADVLERIGSPEESRPLGNLVNLYSVQSKFVEAEASASRALTVISKTYGAESANAASAECGLAQLYMNAGRPADAERLYQEALQIDLKVLPPDHVELGRTYGYLGFFYESQGKKVQAQELYEKALDIFQKTLSPQDPLITTTRQFLARASATGPDTSQSESAMFQQCMNEKIRACMYDCTTNYRFKESKCAKELCSVTNTKTGPENNSLWTSYCQRKVRRQLRDQ